MNNNTSSITGKVWSFCNSLRDVGVGGLNNDFRLKRLNICLS